MRDYTITATIGDLLYVKTDCVFQYDYGLKLVIAGVALPYGFAVEFSNENGAASKRVYGNNNAVDVPDEYLMNGEDIHAYVRVFGNGGNSDYVVYHIRIPVIERPAISEDQTTPTQHEPMLVGLPPYTAEDEGAVLKIVNGVPTWFMER